MEMKTVKMSKENYEWLCKIAGKMQMEEERNISIDEALSKLRKKGNILDLAGSWEMSDEEAEKFLKDTRKGWTMWKKKYA
ncbi:hypothetical protein J4214_03195 [Candidatus Woesearchaeota archaeon]|nr:hypothetical protein [Candidatus Woesearchaeota archaeon]